MCMLRKVYLFIYFFGDRTFAHKQTNAFTYKTSTFTQTNSIADVSSSSLQQLTLEKRR